MPALDVDRPGSDARRVSLRRRSHDILEHSGTDDTVAICVNSALVILILLNVVAFAAETVPAIGERYQAEFRIFNLISVAIFTVEYVLRIWSSVESPVLSTMPHWRARLVFALRPMQLIDLAAILPFYLSFFFAIDLRILRVLRLFRFLKLARYSPALVSIGRVIVNERRALLGALMVMATLLLFASTGIYLLERHAQPEVFGSIPSAAWWALATLTTVGYGDVVPITPAGKVLGGLIMIFGLGMFALPIAIVASGFAQEANRRDFVVTWSMVARVPIFSELTAAAVTEITALLYACSFKEGAVIMRPDDPATAMYFIATGEVQVDADQGPVVLGEGEFFGEMALLDRRTHLHAVTARSRCRLMVLEQNDFDLLCTRMPELFRTVRDIARQRTGEADGV